MVDLNEVVGGGYKEFWYCTKRYRVVKGSRGSKKSKTTALNLIVRLMQYPKANALVIRKTFATLKDSCYSDLCWAIARLGVEPFWKCTHNPLEITYIPTNQRILFRGLDEPLKITSISVPVGVLCFVWLEESSEIVKEDDFNKVDLSIRGNVPEGLFKQITITMNPWSDQHWVKARFFDHPDDDTLALTTTYKCNEWLDDADLKLFEKMRLNNPRRYAIEGEGQWGRSEGLIFEHVELADFDFMELRKRKGIKAAYGLDFGFTDPTAFVACLIDEDSYTIYPYWEIYDTGLTNKALARRIMTSGFGSERFYCDSADPKSIQELRDLGLRAEKARKGPDSVLFGIQLLQNYKFIVHPRCPNTFRDLSNYCWEQDKTGKFIEKPNHDFSHACDAIRYCTSRVLRYDRFSFE